MVHLIIQSHSLDLLNSGLTQLSQIQLL